MHFGEISIAAGRVNKKTGSYLHDVYLAAAWMLQQGIRGNRATWGNFPNYVVNYNTQIQRNLKPATLL